VGKIERPSVKPNKKRLLKFHRRKRNADVRACRCPINTGKGISMSKLTC
jgi:hypothetical protein